MPKDPCVVEVSPLFEVFGIRQIKDLFEAYQLNGVFPFNGNLTTHSVLLSYKPPRDQTLVVERIGLSLSYKNSELYRLLLAGGRFQFYVSGKNYLTMPFWAFLDPTLSVDVWDVNTAEVYADPVIAMSVLASEYTLPFKGIARSFKVPYMHLYRDHEVWFEFRFDEQALSAIKDIQQRKGFFDIGVYLTGKRRTEIR